MNIYDVVIVGAGPVGLATAIGLYTRGVTNILVIDRTRAFREIGHNMDILPNGLKALKYIDSNAYKAVKEAGFKLPKSDNNSQKKKWEYRNTKGEKIPNSSISINYDDWYEKYGEVRSSINWYDLQTTLRNQLPKDLVVANRRCTNIVQESDYVRIDCLCNAKLEANPYAYWEEKEQKENNNTVELISKSLKAKIVVAADGINSTVRKVLYQNSIYSDLAKPEYSGSASISCRGIEVSQAIATEFEEKYLQQNPIVTLVNNSDLEVTKKNITDLMLFGKDLKFNYVLHVNLPWQELKARSGQDLIDLAVKELENTDFPESIKQLVSQSSPDSVIKRLYYIHRATIADTIPFPNSANLVTKNNNEKPDPTWHKGKVVLVGDAAHGMPPFMAQGLNQGLEDAAAISTLIVNLAAHNNCHNTDAINEAFLKYEKLRRPMMQRVQEATIKQYFALSKEELQDYSEQVYSRNLEQIFTALVEK